MEQQDCFWVPLAMVLALILKQKKCCRNIPKNFVVTDKGKSGLISASERREDGL